MSAFISSLIFNQMLHLYRKSIWEQLCMTGHNVRNFTNFWTGLLLLKITRKRLLLLRITGNPERFNCFCFLSLEGESQT